MRPGATRKRWMMMGLVAVLALAPALAEAKARAGSGGSAGSRGARTTEAAPATSVAPTAAPVQRSATPATAAPSPATAARPGAAAAAQPSWAQRNPFMAGMLGGLVGAGLIGMFMGAGLFSGLGSLAGFLGFLLQAALIAGLVFLVIRLFRRRSSVQQPAQRPALATAYAGLPQGGPPAAGPLAGVQFPGALGGGSAAPAGGRDELGLQPADFDAFEEVLGRVQMAWSAGDRAALARVTTPEMAHYFGEELDRMTKLGHVNHIADGKLINGDLAEAWREGAREYATVAMRWSARDWTEDRTGRVIEGNRDQPTETVEVWTFLRVTGGAWVLSAVQQVD